MRKVAFAAAFAACFGVSGFASAADLSLKDTPEPQPNYELSPLWAGLHIGAHVGGGWGNSDVTDTFIYKADPTGNNSFDTTGVLAGVQLGYNFQRGNFVYGVEGDLGWMNLSGDETFDLPNPTKGTSKYERDRDITGNYSLSGGFYGDLTARLGYATENSLLYVKGGAAFLNADFERHYEGQNCSTIRTCGGSRQTSKFDFDDSDTMLGWTIGVGAEYKLTQALSLKLEYQHFDFGSQSYDYKDTVGFDCGGGRCASELSGTVETDLTVDAVTVGLNYQLGGFDDELK
ncbi:MULTISPECIES: outer membrane beta-barrel protein [Rhodomicrobium]|uniref:outer membrane protein n=1 Tax=Rhodomicrobium TaxID=1068 RepID=UPI001481F952|nr:MULTISPECIES: outer membrane beta-barrel protein [Rhodomicrobium]